jgi:hypothetical protein
LPIKGDKYDANIDADFRALAKALDNFKVTNTGSLDSTIRVDIDIKENQFSDKTLQYSLYSKEEEVADGYIEGEDVATIASNIELKNNETVEYTLLIWIAENGKNKTEKRKKK